MPLRKLASRTSYRIPIPKSEQDTLREKGPISKDIPENRPEKGVTAFENDGEEGEGRGN